MKIVLLVIAICLIPILAKALDLGEVAKKEQSRRREVVSSRDGRASRPYTNRDLRPYHRPTEETPPSATGFAGGRSAPSASDRREEREIWRKEKSRLDQELARLDAQIRRLEWRLAERRALRKPGERLQRDATEHVLEESIRALQDQRTERIRTFRERARKAGALPGWLR